MGSMIAAEQIFQLSAVLLGLAAFGFWVETKPIGRKLSGALIIIFLGMLFANLRLIPHSAPMYGTVSSLLVPLAIPMLLFRADLQQVFKEIGPMLKAFVASVAVMTSAIVLLTLVFDFGEFEAKVAGVMAASYIGGSVNFVATAQAVELTDSTHYVGALTADAIGAVFFLTLLMMMPALALVRRLMPSSYIADDGSNTLADTSDHAQQNTAPFDLVGLAAAIAVSMAICALADLLVQTLGLQNLFIFIVTLLALIVANFCKPLVRRFNAEFEVGTFLMYLFFVVIGAGADLTSVVGVAFPYVVLIGTAIMLFFAIILVVGKYLKLDLAELMVAANACILGPATAAAMAAGKGWKTLITPGMLAGVLGYSIATFIGVAVVKLLT